MQIILHGGKEKFSVNSKTLGVTREYKIDFEGIATIIESTYNNSDSTSLKRWAKDFFKDLPNHLSEKQKKTSGEIVKEINARLRFLVDVGLTYLSLNRSSKSLSGGEAQRIRLATQIGSQLVGVLYILDEPSIGLHPKDTEIHLRQSNRYY